MISEQELKIISLYGIWKGYLSFIPDNINYIETEGVLFDIFVRATSIVLHDNGDRCLHKETIKSGIHRNVTKMLGDICCVCGAATSESHVHHIKQKKWSWGRALGFCILCEDCHKPIHTGILPYTEKQIKAICKEIAPPAVEDWHGTFLTRHTIDRAINYYSLALQ